MSFCVHHEAFTADLGAKPRLCGDVEQFSNPAKQYITVLNNMAASAAPQCGAYFLVINDAFWGKPNHMITWVDIYPLTTGNIVIRVPELLPPKGELTIVVKETAFALYCEKEKVAHIAQVEPFVLEALAVSELIGILEQPEGEEPPEYLERYAKVVDKMPNQPSKKVIKNQ